MADLTSTQMITPLRTAIAAAAGIDLARGDTLAVEPLKFDRSYSTQQAAETQKNSMTDLILKVAAVVGAVLLLLILLWYIQRLLTNVRLASNEAWTPVMLGAAEAAEVAAVTAGHASAAKGLDEAVSRGSQGIPAPTRGGSLPGGIGSASAGGLGLGGLDDLELPSAPQAAPIPIRPVPVLEPMSAEDEQIQRHIVKLAEEEPTSIADIIHMWLAEDERRNG
jgi:flagellar biosynthesis/type III secretory pathway M-ring protein FliF/YscJ